MQNPITIPALTAKVTEIFSVAGLHPQQAAAMARTLVAGERDGCKSHGVYRIEGALRTVKAGKVNAGAEPELIVDETGIVRVAANGGYSPWAFELGAPVLADKARQLGLAALVINDCVHFTALWPEVEALASFGVASIAMCPSYATVAPAGSSAAASIHACAAVSTCAPS